MEPNRFDSLARSLRTTGSRRWILALVSGLGALGLTPTEAKKKKHKKKKFCKCAGCARCHHGRCRPAPDGTACTLPVWPESPGQPRYATIALTTASIRSAAATRIAVVPRLEM